jgi:hypothetical protein
MTFRDKVQKVVEPICLHLIGMCATVVSIWLFHMLLHAVLGEDATLFGTLPIVYLAHTGDLVAFLRFIWSAIREFRDV